MGNAELSSSRGGRAPNVVLDAALRGCELDLREPGLHGRRPLAGGALDSLADAVLHSLLNPEAERRRPTHRAF